MNKRVSLTLSDEFVQCAEVVAGHSGRQVEGVLTEVIEAWLDPVVLPRADVRRPAEWSVSLCGPYPRHPRNQRSIPCRLNIF
jgi:hypothetical protein